jgi:hypothetical protein
LDKPGDHYRSERNIYRWRVHHDSERGGWALHHSRSNSRYLCHIPGIGDSERKAAMNRLPQGDWSTLVSLGRWMLTACVRKVDSQLARRWKEKFTEAPENLADTMHDDGINWTEILLWILSGIGTLLAFAFKAKLDGKMDKDQVGKLIDEAIDRYHEKVVRAIQAETLRMHEQNQQRMRDMEAAVRDLIGVIVKKNGNGI